MDNLIYKTNKRLLQKEATLKPFLNYLKQLSIKVTPEVTGFKMRITDVVREPKEQANLIITSMGIKMPGYSMVNNHKNVTNKKSLTGYNSDTIIEILKEAGVVNKKNQESVKTLIDKAKGGKKRDYKNTNLTATEKKELETIYKKAGETFKKKFEDFVDWVKKNAASFKHLNQESKTFAIDFTLVSIQTNLHYNNELTNKKDKEVYIELEKALLSCKGQYNIIDIFPEGSHFHTVFKY